MEFKQYKGDRDSNLANIIEWINDWATDRWTLHTFTHQETDEGVWHVAVLEKTVTVEDDED